MAHAQPPVPSIEALHRLLGGLQTFIREHLALARAEIKDDARAMARELMVSAAGLPALISGYLLLMIAAGYLLSLWLPLWAAFGIVGLLNLAGGGAITWLGLRKVIQTRVSIPGTGEELQRDKAWLSNLGRRDTWQTPAGTRPQFAPASSAPANRSNNR